MSISWLARVDVDWYECVELAGEAGRAEIKDAGGVGIEESDMDGTGPFFWSAFLAFAYIQ